MQFHGNASGGTSPLDLTPRESLSALRVVNMLHDQADELGDGTLALVWRAEAQEHRRLLLPGLGDAFPVTCSCGQPADGIDERGAARCAACAEGGESS